MPLTVCRRSILTFDRHLSLAPSFPLLTSFRGSQRRWLRTEATLGGISGGLFWLSGIMNIRPSCQKGTHMLCVRLEAVCLNPKHFFFHSHCRFSLAPTTARHLLLSWLRERWGGWWGDLRRTYRPDSGRGLLSVRSGMTHLCLSVHACLRQRYRQCVCVCVWICCLRSCKRD